MTLLHSPAWAAWTVKRVYNQTGSFERCVVESHTAPVSDGYQETQVTLVVHTDMILVKTKAPLDDSFGDIGLQVEKHDLIKMDKVVAESSALFSTSYKQILGQLQKEPAPVKKGRKPASTSVRVQLRFWPTWPVTGTHAVEFSLEGFSKAYAEMVTCK